MRCVLELRLVPDHKDAHEPAAVEERKLTSAPWSLARAASRERGDRWIRSDGGSQAAVAAVCAAEA
ncbi:hypothetical protein CRG98_025594 [Punica granatum]|uniref:Uncharacterized protein n=1 Tax=Punica granatum TaxID=22663 RepID=A0A2I0JDA1_PUNGR|nr:hypothetical protein CRG98_025594 [Punica granatum]